MKEARKERKKETFWVREGEGRFWVKVKTHKYTSKKQTNKQTLRLEEEEEEERIEKEECYKPQTTEFVHFSSQNKCFTLACTFFDSECASKQ